VRTSGVSCVEAGIIAEMDKYTPIVAAPPRHFSAPRRGTVANTFGYLRESFVLVKVTTGLPLSNERHAAWRMIAVGVINLITRCWDTGIRPIEST